MLTGLLLRQAPSRSLKAAAVCLFLGMLLFSGSLLRAGALERSSPRRGDSLRGSSHDGGLGAARLGRLEAAAQLCYCAAVFVK